MKAMTMSMAVFASAFLIPFGNHSIIRNTKTVSKVQKSSVLSANTNLTTQVNTNIIESSVIYTVQPGDNLSKIAEANGTTVERLFFANTDISNPDLIFINQKFRIPKKDESLAVREIPKNQQIVVQESNIIKSNKVQRTVIVATTPVVDGTTVWDSLAACESGGNWAINTGNGYYGGLQFTLSSWQGVGGSGYPNEASREEQIARGQILQSRGGWGNWPACASKLGLI